MIVRRTEQLRIGLTDDNFLMPHLNPMKIGSKIKKEISHMENVGHLIDFSLTTLRHLI